MDRGTVMDYLLCKSLISCRPKKTHKKPQKTEKDVEFFQKSKIQILSQGEHTNSIDVLIDKGFKTTFTYRANLIWSFRVTNCRPLDRRYSNRLPFDMYSVTIFNEFLSKIIPLRQTKLSS
jgi:hypothetical protein